MLKSQPAGQKPAAESLVPIAAPQPRAIVIPCCAFMARQAYRPNVFMIGESASLTAASCPCQGYETEGCEHSWFMLISSAFMLNGADAAHQFTVHPWVASVNNQPSTAAQLRGVSLHRAKSRSDVSL